MAKTKAEDSPLDDNVLRDEERRLWKRAMRDAKPLKRGKLLPSAKLQPEQSKKPASLLNGRHAAPALPVQAQGGSTLAKTTRWPELAAGEAPGVDARTAERLRRGGVPIDAQLDLHGHTQEEAHRALVAFVEAAWRRRLRCLLVITGKGHGGSFGAREGVLKARVPRWLNGSPLRSRILAFANAQPKDGGSGAFYVLLRRQR